MSNSLNFAGATRTPQYPLIQPGTLVKVRLNIQEGDFNNEARGWIRNMATQNTAGTVYLKCEFNILEGEFQGRKIWSLIGLHSPKGDWYATNGRVFMREILESSLGVNPSDNSDLANSKRIIESIADLDNIIFIAEISVGKDQKGEDKNEIKKAITPEHPKYAKLMSGDGHDELPF